MRAFLFLLGTASTLSAGAQAPSQMVETERSFAAHSVEKGTRAAFLSYMDTGAVMYQKGVVVNGYQLWMAKQNRPGLLDWKPLVNELSGSGDWGFTTGPWTFRKTSADTVAARGHFITIWKKEPDGSWKFIFDTGSEGGDEPQQVLYTFNSPKTRGSVEDLWKAERHLDGSLLLGDTAVRRRYRSASSVLCRNGAPDALTPADQDRWLLGLPARISFNPGGHLLAPGGDMALVYGTTASTSGEAHPYARVWRHEAGGWKIAAELLSF